MLIHKTFNNFMAVTINCELISTEEKKSNNRIYCQALEKEPLLLDGYLLGFTQRQIHTNNGFREEMEDP